MTRSSAERIHNDYKKMMRKVNIMREVDRGRGTGYSNWLSGYCPNGQYHRVDKGKIHCSCWMCRGHLQNEKRISELRRMEELEYEDDFGTQGE